MLLGYAKSRQGSLIKQAKEAKENMDIDLKGEGMLEKPKDSFKKPEPEEKEEEIYFRLSEETKAAIVTRIKSQVEEAEIRRSKFMAIREESIKLYEGITEPSDDPWPGHSNISTMVTTIAADLLHANIFSMVWNEDSITWEGREEHDNETAEVNKTVMAWVTSVDMKLQDKIDDIVHLLVVDGTIAVKLVWEVYYKFVTRKTPKITAHSLITGKVEYEVSYDYIRDERCKLDVRPLERVYLPFFNDN